MLIKSIVAILSIIILYAVIKNQAETKKIVIKNTVKAGSEISNFILPDKFKPVKEKWAIKKEWIAPKTLKECMKENKIIDNQTIRCRNGYYIDVKVLLN